MRSRFIMWNLGFGLVSGLGFYNVWVLGCKEII